MDIIDIHVHPVSRKSFHDERNLRILDRSAQCLASENPISKLLERMDAGRIQRACLMGPNPWDGNDLTNEAVRDMVNSHPERFWGFLGPDPARDGEANTRTLIQRGIQDWKFRGVGEIGGGDLLTSEWDVVFQTCLDLDVPVLVHVGIPLPSMSLQQSHPFFLDDLAHRYPSLTIIAAHVGVPWVFETISIAIRHPNVHLDISAIPAFNPMIVAPIVSFCIDSELEDQILFGSDFPVVDPGRYAESVRRLKVPFALKWLLRLPAITPDAKDKLLSRNARRLLRIEP